MTATGSGLQFQIAVKDEATYGVAPSLSAGVNWYITKGSTLKGKKTPVQGEGLFAGALYGKASRRAVVEWTADGAIPMELPQRGLQQWLFRMFGSFGQSPAALTQDGTTGAYKAVHAPGTLLGHSFTVQRGVPAVDGTVEPMTSVGCKVEEWELTFDRGQIVQLALTVDGRNELGGAGNSDPLNVSVPALATYAEPPGGVFTFAGASVFTGGTPSTTAGVTNVSGASLAGNIKSGSLKHALSLDKERVFSGGAGFKGEQLENGVRQVTGAFVIEWLSSQAVYNAYAADTATTIQYQFLGPAIGSGSDFSTLTVLVPNIHFDEGPPDVDGPAVVTQSVTWTGLDNSADNVVQATYWTLDSA